MTVNCAWIKSRNVNTVDYQLIVGKSQMGSTTRQYDFYIDSAKVKFAGSNGSSFAAYSSAIQNNTWYHVPTQAYICFVVKKRWHVPKRPQQAENKRRFGNTHRLL